MSDIDPALREAELPSKSAHPTWILRFFEQVERPQRPAGEEQLEEAERHVTRHVGSLKLAPSGKLDMDIRSATLQGVLSLNVFPVMEADAWIMGDPDSIDRLEEHCVAACTGRFTVERVRAEEDDETLREAAFGSVSPDWGGPAAPWSPLPLRQARQYISRHPDAQIEIEFPTVYEEDRTAKMADLTVAEQQKVISHRRYAEQVAKELGVAQYDYDEEQADIRLHPNPAQPPAGLPGLSPGGAPGLGVDPTRSAGLANRVRATMAGQAPEPAAGAGHRPGLGAEDRAAFRNDQAKINEAAARLEAATARAVDAFAAHLPSAPPVPPAVPTPAGPPPAIVLRHEVSEADPTPPPAVHVHAPATVARARRIEYDDEGRVARIVDEPVVPPASETVSIVEAAAPPAEDPAPPAAPAADIHVHVPQPGPRVRTVEYDAEGRIVRVVDDPDPDVTA